MTTEDRPTLPDEPTQPPINPTPPVVPEPAPAAGFAPITERAPVSRAGGPRLGHIVLGAILVLIGVGWLLQALDLADVPWRFLLPAALIIVGVALTVGARSGSHGGLVAVGVVLTVLVLFAGAIDALADIPFAGGIGDESHTPTAAIEDEYRWGMGKMTLDLRAAENLAGREIAASVAVGELIVIVPPDATFRVTAHAGVGEVIVLGQQSGGFDTELECAGTGAAVTCGEGSELGPPTLQLNLEVAIGKVEVQR
jgi:hypothetical protein